MSEVPGMTDMHGLSDDENDRWLDEQLGPGPAEVARSNAADLERWKTSDLVPGLEYLPAEVEQHQRDQLQQEYDAGMYRDDVVPGRIVTTQEIVQEIRDGYARDVDPVVQVARAQVEIADQIAADWA